YFTKTPNPKEVLFAYNCKSMRSEHDIPINEDQWINWIEFDAQSVDPIDVDTLIKPLNDFFSKLEIVCLAECCGVGAFSFFPNDITNASKDFNAEYLPAQLDKLINEISEIKGQVIVSEKLNQLMHASVFMELLKHIRSN